MSQLANHIKYNYKYRFSNELQQYFTSMSTNDTEEGALSIDNTVNDLIINAIKLRTPLWDMRDKLYKDNIHKRKLWAEIAFELQIDEAFAKTRWKSLRDRYFKEKKKLATKSGQGANGHSGWAFMSLMTFISGTVDPRVTITSMTSISRIPPSCSQSAASSNARNNASMADVEVLDTQVDINDAPMDLLGRSSSINLQELPLPSTSDASAFEPPSRKRPESSPVVHNGTSQSTRNPKRTHNEHDPVDMAILGLINKRQQNADSLPKQDFSPDEHFYLSIARDVKNFSLSNRIRMRQAVLNSFASIFEDEIADTNNLNLSFPQSF